MIEEEPMRPGALMALALLAAMRPAAGWGNDYPTEARRDTSSPAWPATAKAAAFLRNALVAST